MNVDKPFGRGKYRAAASDSCQIGNNPKVTARRGGWF